MNTLSNKPEVIKESKENNEKFFINIDILNHFSNHLLNSYSYKTSKEYVRIIRKLLGKQEYISKNKIEGFLTNKEKARNYNTVSLAAVKLFMAYINNKYDFKMPPIIYPRLKAERKVRNASPTTKELKTLLEAFKLDYKNRLRVYDYSLFIETMIRTGCRISEPLRLLQKNTSLHRFETQKEWGIFKITKAKGNKERIIDIPTDLMQKIYNMIIERDGELDPDKMVFDFDFYGYRDKKFKKLKKDNARFIKGDATAENIIFHKYLAKCEDDIQKRIKELSRKYVGRQLKSHSFRAARATFLEDKGIAVSMIRDILGHENISTTSIYLRNRQEEIKSNLMKIDSF